MHQAEAHRSHSQNNPEPARRSAHRLPNPSHTATSFRNRSPRVCSKFITRSRKSVDGLPLFTGMPRRVLLGNGASGILHSRKPSLRTLAYLCGTRAHTGALPSITRRSSYTFNLAGRISSPPRHRGDLPVKGTISLPSKCPHPHHTTGTGSGRPYDGFSKP